MKNQPILQQVMKESLPGVGQALLLVGSIILFKPSFITLCVIFLGLHVITSFYKAHKEREPKGKKWWLRLGRTTATLLITINILYLINYYLGGWGWVGLFLTVIIISGYILYTKRKQYIRWVRLIEKMIWGKTAEERKEAKR